MAIFRYKVSDKTGKIHEREVEAETQTAAVSKLRAEGVMPVAMVGSATGVAHRRSKASGPRFDALDFTRRLAPLLRSHVQLAKGLSILEEGTAAGTSKEVVSQLRRGLHEGKRFSQLIKDQGNLFPQIYSGLIAAGEEGGLLSETVQELEKFLQQKKEMRSFLISNSIYPVLVLTVTLGVILFLLFFVIPKFAQTLGGTGKPLPAMISLMMDMNHTIAALWWFWLGIAGGVIFLTVQIKKGGAWRTRWDKWMVSIPMWKNFVKMVECALFFRTLGMLTSNHLHLLPSVRTSIEVISNRVVSRSLQHVPDALKKGEKLSTAIKQSPYIDASYIQLVRIGEESGHLGEMIASVADIAEGSMKEYIGKLIALFVPVTILLLSVVVAFVVIAIFMAVMQMKG